MAGPPVLVVDHELYLKHDPGELHPESPQRLAAVRDHAARLHGIELRRLEPAAATAAELQRVHSPRHLERVTQARGRSLYFDPDTGASPDSVDAAFMAVGGGLAAMRAVATASDGGSAFAWLRPPGHHAEHDRAMGFCFFNNVAVAAAAALAEGLARRVAIMDWDVHHGNGSQHSFEDHPDVLYVSTHRYPFYPGSGHYAEAGRGAGIGATVNVPLEAEATDGDLGYAFSQVVLPAIEDFKPDLILVSAGFDAHRRDPLGGMLVSTEAFAALCGALLELARRRNGRGLALFLEGGYDLQGLGASVAACLQVLAGSTPPPLAQDARASTKRVVDAVRETHRHRW